MGEMKTKPTEASVESFLAEVTDEKVRTDCFTLVSLMERIAGEKAVMWGPSIVGFGKYRYNNHTKSGGEICLTGFSPRKNSLSLYCLSGFTGQSEMLQQLGKHKAGKGCLYIKKLDDVNLDVLQNLLATSVAHLKKIFPD